MLKQWLALWNSPLGCSSRCATCARAPSAPPSLLNFSCFGDRRDLFQERLAVGGEFFLADAGEGQQLLFRGGAGGGADRIADLDGRAMLRFARTGRVGDDDE